MDTPKRIALISTGGTIEKTYDAMEGVLANQVNVLDVLLAQIIMSGVELVRVPLMNKDSTEMSEADHTLIAKTAAAMGEVYEGVIIVHGTDRLANTGERMHELFPGLAVPVVLTGAMRPYELRHSDAVQNVTEALLAVDALAPGVYVVMQNRVLRFPGVVKDRERGIFVSAPG